MAKQMQSGVLEIPRDAEGGPRPWSMPKPGSYTVTWRFGDNSGERCAAIVTAIHTNSIDLMAFTSTGQLIPRVGVKHVSDPSLRRMSQPNPGGVWDFTPMERQVRQLIGVEPE